VIRITRPPEPPALAAVRPARLAAAAAAVALGQKISFDGYDRAKPALAEMQYSKCCYCEKREEQAKYRDVEHYRPKSPYWWLAWTWENLLFACIDCNREHKRDQFPCAPGDVALQPHEQPPGGELPLVINPAEVDPIDEIHFVCEKHNGRERWLPRGTSAGGRSTVAVCKLDRPGLLDLYLEHVNQQVRPRTKLVIDAARATQPREVVANWSRATRSLLAPARPFRALSHDALAVLVAPALRARYQLPLARP